MTISLQFGADPEVFVRKGGKFLSAHGMVQGTKEAPFKVDKGAVQVDGMALEFNIDPAKNADEFVENIDTVINILQGMVPDYELVAEPTATFGKVYMSTQPPEALELGCEPDFNAYDGGKPNVKPDGDVDFRTGAGHLHIGWTEGVDISHPDHLEACMTVVKQLDYSIGILSTLFDGDEKRRQLYGDWGCFRPKPYGVEYRTLSNAWLKDKRIQKWLINTANQAIQDLHDGHHRYLDKSPSSISRDVLIKYVTMVFGYEAPPKL